jgi:hypothetical protein
MFPQLPVYILSVAAGKYLVSKEVNICYRGHMPQQADYQLSSTLVAALKTLHSKYVTL